MKDIKQLFKNNFPSYYKYCRKVYLNSSNHLVWLVYKYGKTASEANHDPYSKQFWDAQENWDYESFAKVLNYHFKPSSALDVGCGSGTILSAFRRVDKNLRLVGIENSPEALSIAQQRALEVRELNIGRCSKGDIQALCEALGEFDITLCLEVAEHLPVWHTNKLLQILIGTSETVVFSAAQPGQGGPLHLNEQPPEYWISKFLALKYAFDRQLSDEIKEELSQINIPSWYKANLLVFHRA